jgi:hypothetical protein
MLVIGNTLKNELFELFLRVTNKYKSHTFFFLVEFLKSILEQYPNHTYFYAKEIKVCKKPKI